MHIYQLFLQHRLSSDVSGLYLLHTLVQIPDDDTKQKILELKEEVKKMLLAAAHQPDQQLKLIDDLQRLGVAYHFEAEINLALGNINGIFSELFGTESEYDLRMVALCFRLLRQQGYDVSSGKLRYIVLCLK